MLLLPMFWYREQHFLSNQPFFFCPLLNCFYNAVTNSLHDDGYGYPLQILDTPSLLAEGSKGVKKNIFNEKRPQPDVSTSSCCWFGLVYLCIISRSLTKVVMVIPLQILKK